MSRGDGDPEHGLPYVHGLLFGGDLTMAIAYRLTVMTTRLTAATPRLNFHSCEWNSIGR